MSRLKQASDKNLLAKLEQDLKGEFDAIHLYQQHIDVINIPEVKNKLIEIRDEEKVHSKELEELIKKYK